ncbi:MAG: hypothetical protein AAF429_04890 [Pseudomonadota bacterium]
MAVEIRLFEAILIDSKHMKNTNIPASYLIEIEEIIEKRCLPEDTFESVHQIMKSRNEEQIREDLEILTGECYRMDPNHTRYNKRRNMFPAL